MRSEGVPCFHEFARREGAHRSLKLQSPINILHIQIVSDVRPLSPIPWPQPIVHRATADWPPVG